MHTYTRRSVHAHITILPETSAPTYPYLPLPSAPTEPFAQSASAPVCPSCPRLPSRCRPKGQRPTSRTRHCVRARRPVCAIASAPATRLRPLPRRRGGPHGSQRGQGKSDLPWPPVNARLTLTRRARRSIGRTGRAGGPPHRQPCLLSVRTRENNLFF
jgi:hypothetical protein